MLSTLQLTHIRNVHFKIRCEFAASLSAGCICFGVTLCMVNSDVGTTLFHFRLLCAAHTCGITAVIAVATSRPVVASSLCTSEWCHEIMRTSATDSERCNCWVCVFVFNVSNLHGS